MNGITYVWQRENYNFEHERYIPVKVYEFEIEEDEIVPYTEVSKYVPDAHYTKECWSLKAIKPIKSYLIEPTYIGMSDNYPKHVVYVEYEVLDEDWRISGYDWRDI